MNPATAMITCPIRVDVTAEDIANGEPLRGSSCPVALALKRIVGGAAVDVWCREARIGRYDAVWPLPPEAQEFIRRFDGGYPVRPFSFTLGGSGSEATT